jgi:hypothetical protein
VVSLIIVGFFIGPLIYFRWKKWIWVRFQALLFKQGARNMRLFDECPFAKHKKKHRYCGAFALDDL